MAQGSIGQKGPRGRTLRNDSYPFNTRDNELQSEAQFPKDPDFDDKNTLTNERMPTINMVTKAQGKVGESKKTESTMSEAWDEVHSLEENARLQYIHTDLNGGGSE